MPRSFIHVDMDAFYAQVESRDDPSLAGKPLIIGALPNERGIVSTCSYEARKYGVRSGMSIKEAYCLCPNGLYKHPTFSKYKEASDAIRAIWDDYTDLITHVSLDEGFMDVTGSAHLFGGPRKIALEIKRRIKEKTRLTCSAGVGYSVMSSKLASEEKKPDGYFEILTPEFLTSLIIDRGVRVIYGVGGKTAAALKNAGIVTVRDMFNNRSTVISMLGNYGRQIIELAEGVDNRRISPQESDAKSMGKEHTFQEDITDTETLKATLRFIAKELSYGVREKELYCHTVTLKITYCDMKKITRAHTNGPINGANEIYKTAEAMLDGLFKRPIRLIGITLSGFCQPSARQITLDDTGYGLKREAADETVLALQKKYGIGIIKTGGELWAEKEIGPFKEPSVNTFSLNPRNVTT